MSACNIAQQVFATLLPILFGYLIAYQKYDYLLYGILAWQVINGVEYFALNYLLSFLATLNNSLKYHAYIACRNNGHFKSSTKSPGSLFGKIEHGSLAYRTLIDWFLRTLLTEVAEIITIIISFFSLNQSIGLLCFICVVFCVGLNVFMIIFSKSSFENKIITAEDHMRGFLLANLNSTDENFEEQAHAKSLETTYIANTSASAQAANALIAKISYTIGCFIIGIKIFSEIQNGTLSGVIGTTMLLTYVQSAYSITTGLGEAIFTLTESAIRVRDFFAYVRAENKN